MSGRELGPRTGSSPSQLVPIFAPMATTIDMIAHCMFHQTPVSERARCEVCGSELAEAGGKVYCPHCLVERPSGACPICARR